MYIRNKREQLEDPSVVEFYRELDAVIDSEPGDPRLPALADRIVAQLEALDDGEWQAFAEDPMSDDLVDLLDSMFLDQVPIAGELKRAPRGTRLDRLDEVRARRRVAGMCGHSVLPKCRFRRGLTTAPLRSRMEASNETPPAVQPAFPQWNIQVRPYNARMARRMAKPAKPPGDAVAVALTFNHLFTMVVVGIVEDVANLIPSLEDLIEMTISLASFYWHRVVLVTDGHVYIYRDLPFHRPGKQLNVFERGTEGAGLAATGTAPREALVARGRRRGGCPSRCPTAQVRSRRRAGGPPRPRRPRPRRPAAAAHRPAV